MCDLFIFAGEKSADLHGEKLILALRAKNPNLKISGVGGPRMRGAGMDCVLQMEDFQVMGFIDVFCALPKLMRQFYFVVSEIERLEPKTVVTIDYPGFNLRLAKHLKKKKFAGKLVHFICPSVWAWGKKRIDLMQKNLDLLLCILPFEKELFSSERLQVNFVGHPLVERLREYNYKPLNFVTNKKIIAIFPGSRKKEIQRNLGMILNALKGRTEELVAISVSDERFAPLILKTVREKGWNADQIELVPGDFSYELMKSAHIAIAKSGTVTLELALHKVPTVVIYGVSFLDKIIAYHILRIRLQFYCLVNIIAGKEVFPELMGPHFTADALKIKINDLFKEKFRAKMQRDCQEIIEQLGSIETSTEAASVIGLRIAPL